MADVHVLIVYSLVERRLLSRREFESDEQDEAFQAYAQAEEAHRDLSDVEIVLVAADSLATIRHTHGSYFRGEVETMDLALAQLLNRS